MTRSIFVLGKAIYRLISVDYLMKDRATVVFSPIAPSFEAALYLLLLLCQLKSPLWELGKCTFFFLICLFGVFGFLRKQLFSIFENCVFTNRFSFWISTALGTIYSSIVLIWGKFFPWDSILSLFWFFFELLLITAVLIVILALT